LDYSDITWLLNRVIALEKLRKLLTKNINSWDQLFQKLINIPGDSDNQEAGYRLEEIAKLYYIQLGEYKQVWSYKEIPNKRNLLACT